MLLGMLLGWATATLTPTSVRLSLVDAGWGLAAVVPLLGAILLAPELRRRVRELLGAQIAACSWLDLAALACLAGLGEEILFRGVIEPWLARWHPWAGLIGANLLFGLAHAISLTYFGFATAIGCFLSWLAWGWPGSQWPWDGPNLLRSIIAHAVYDFIAFQIIAHDYRRLTATGTGTEP